MHWFGPEGVLPKCANCASIKEVCRAHWVDEQQVSWGFFWGDSGRWEAQMQSRRLEMFYGSKDLTHQGAGEESQFRIMFPIFLESLEGSVYDYK